MMPGVAAQPLGRRSSTPLPDALASMRFLTGSYVVNGVTLTAADIVANPELITADGLVITEDVVDIVNAWLLANLPNATCVLAWDHLDYTGNIVPLALIDPDTSDDGMVIKRQASGQFMDVTDFSGVHFRDATDASAAVGDNGHKIAWTRTDTALEFSVDGRAVVTYAGDPDTFSIVPTAASFGGLPGGFTFAEVRIKSLIVYAPQISSLLPTLSA